MTHRLVIIPTLALALAACTADVPSMARAAPPADPAQSLAVSGEPLDALLGTLSDARVRLLPAIGDPEAQSRLGGVLSRVTDALVANDANALAEALDVARTALEAEIQRVGTDSPTAADLDALGLALDGVDQALPAHMRAR